MVGKTKYIVKHLSRTKRKDYENYVVNRLWNRLDDDELKPVAQQYVLREGRNYALIDLYFPQLNIGIECDEQYHEKQVDEDQLRFDDIFSAIKEYKEIRVPITEGGQERSIQDINYDIDCAVEEIRNRKQELISKGDFNPWVDQSDIVLAKERGKISVKDCFTFTQEEVRGFFGREGKSQRCFYKIKENGDYLWLPALAIEIASGKYISYKVNNKEFINIYEQDEVGKPVILECLLNYNPEIPQLVEDYHRIVFAKRKDRILNEETIVFLGVFKKDSLLVEREINGKKKIFSVHRLVASDVEP